MEKVAAYAKAIVGEYGTGHAAGHAHRPALKRLIEELRPELIAVNDPKRSAYGAPDFIFIRRENKELIAGYGEAKDLTVKLDDTSESEQMKRYLGYATLLLTNYLEFRFYKNGKEYGQPITIGKLAGGTLVFDESQFGRLEDELRSFLGKGIEPITSASHLAEVMGAVARRLRDNVARFLADEEDRNADLQKVYQAMKKLLVDDLSPERFADLYSQTLVYGLFAARYEDPTLDTFTRQEARDLIPHTNPFLRQFFDHIAGPSFDLRLAYVVNELCDVFLHADVRELMHKYYTQNTLFGEGKESPDPVIHFYEDFLREYDAEARKKYGVFYTPVPVVRFIVRSVDEILKRDFGLADGLAGTAQVEASRVVQGKKKKVSVHKVQVLDPATGTGTFLNEAIRHIRRSFAGNEGAWPGYVRDHLLPRIHGFELLMASYTIAHLKLGMELRESGAGDLRERLGIYLTNSLEEGVKQEDSLFGFGLAEQIAEEGKQAAVVKRDLPVMVVMGNPPYSGVSSNESEYANKLVERYKAEPGGVMKLQERKHWLNDDYVKFIALAETLVDKTGEGVVGYITNHGYLDNPTFRGMRWRLLQTFDHIYILDLHGNLKKKEKSPNNLRDENVFAIQQGVAIMIAVKTGMKRKGTSGQVHHAELWGRQAEKFRELNGHIDYVDLPLDEKLYSFVPRNSTGLTEYESGFNLHELFPVNVTGIVTARDGLVIDSNKQKLEDRIKRFADPERSDSEIRAEFFPNRKPGKYLAGDTRGWKINQVRPLIQNEIHGERIVPIAYRPLDIQYIYYHPRMVDWGREKIMAHLLGKNNLGLIFKRGDVEPLAPPVFASTHIAESRSWSRPGMQGVEYIAPLYLYEGSSREANLNRAIIEKIEESVGKSTPEDIFDYIYAVLHSPAYREKYKEFLKIDFPRVPYPSDWASFDALAGKGRELRMLHTLETVPPATVTFPEMGSDTVDAVKYDAGKVRINGTQHFAGVPQEAWDMFIGGYQPAQKWLKDRKGRKLSSDDIKHYGHIIGILLETQRIMGEINEISV